jgi:hypothetical protein
MGAEGQRLVSREFGMREWARKWEELYLGEAFPRSANSAANGLHHKSTMGPPHSPGGEQ